MSKNLTYSLSWKFLKYLFDENDFPNDYYLKKIKLDSTSIYSITPYKFAKSIIDIIIKHTGTKDLTITDACACIGGDTINFCKTFSKVNAIELCIDRFDFLKDNLKLYGFRNYKLYNYDCLKLLNKIYQDVVYFDLPWGGKSYKEKIECDLKLSGKHIYDICNNIKKNTKYICLKVPNNFYFQTFKSNILFTNYNQYDLEKFQLIIIS
jgi:hypothetical protein